MLGARDEATGLYRRAYLFDRINDAIGAVSDKRSELGGVAEANVAAAEAEEAPATAPVVTAAPAEKTKAKKTEKQNKK